MRLGISYFDEWIRDHLHDFASIPVKASLIATELLAKLDVVEPAEIKEKSERKEISDAIKSHRARFDQLRAVWPELAHMTTPTANRRYRQFYQDNQKIMDGFMRQFAAGPEEEKTLDLASARHIEERYRETVAKAARFMVCAMLLSEHTEFRVRRHLQRLKF